MGGTVKRIVLRFLDDYCKAPKCKSLFNKCARTTEKARSYILNLTVRVGCADANTAVLKRLLLEP
jgi:hypothetical protein